MLYAFVAAVVAFTALAAVVDVRRHRVPNYLTVSAAAAAVVFHALWSDGLGVGASLAGLALGFALLFVPWLLGGSGMGDVKLLAALGAWLGPRYLLLAFATSVLAAAAIAVGMLIVSTIRRGVTKTKQTYLASAQGPTATRRRVRVLPLAVPVALSTWCVLAMLVARGGL